MDTATMSLADQEGTIELKREEETVKVTEAMAAADVAKKGLFEEDQEKAGSDSTPIEVVSDQEETGDDRLIGKTELTPEAGKEDIFIHDKSMESNISSIKEPAQATEQTSDMPEMTKDTDVAVTINDIVVSENEPTVKSETLEEVHHDVVDFGKEMETERDLSVALTISTNDQTGQSAKDLEESQISSSQSEVDQLTEQNTPETSETKATDKEMAIEKGEVKTPEVETHADLQKFRPNDDVTTLQGERQDTIEIVSAATAGGSADEMTEEGKAGIQTAEDNNQENERTEKADSEKVLEKDVKFEVGDTEAETVKPESVLAAAEVVGPTDIYQQEEKEPEIDDPLQSTNDTFFPISMPDAKQQGEEQPDVAEEPVEPSQQEMSGHPESDIIDSPSHIVQTEHESELARKESEENKEVNQAEEGQKLEVEIVQLYLPTDPQDMNLFMNQLVSRMRMSVSDKSQHYVLLCKIIELINQWLIRRSIQIQVLQSFPVTNTTIEQASLIGDEASAVSYAVDQCITVSNTRDVEKRHSDDDNERRHNIVVVELCKLQGRVSAIKESVSIILNSEEPTFEAAKISEQETISQKLLRNEPMSTTNEKSHVKKCLQSCFDLVETSSDEKATKGGEAEAKRDFERASMAVQVSDQLLQTGNDESETLKAEMTSRAETGRKVLLEFRNSELKLAEIGDKMKDVLEEISDIGDRSERIGGRVEADQTHQKLLEILVRDTLINLFFIFEIATLSNKFVQTILNGKIWCLL